MPALKVFASRERVLQGLSKSHSFIQDTRLGDFSSGAEKITEVVNQFCKIMAHATEPSIGFTGGLIQTALGISPALGSFVPNRLGTLR